MDAQEAIELGEIEQRLLTEFGDTLAPAEIKARLDKAVARFDDASIRTHVMLLIERRVTADLRVAAAAQPACEGSSR